MASHSDEAQSSMIVESTVRNQTACLGFHRTLWVWVVFPFFSGDYKRYHSREMLVEIGWERTRMNDI
jgi:hypothetical protein